MQIMYLTGAPIQHEGVVGREIPAKKSELFTEEEAEKIYYAAISMEGLFNNLFRMDSIKEAYAELKAEIKDIKGPDRERDRRIIRRVRSYILEYDIFLKHWEKYFGNCVENGKEKYKKITSAAFDNDEAYALICTLRNYLVHSADIVHGQHIGFDEFKLWAGRDRIIKDMDWPKAKKELLQRQAEKIDILKLIDDSLEPIQKVHEQFMGCQLTDKIKENCNYLHSMFGRTIPVKAVAWFAFDFGEMEMAPGTVKMGANYVELNWQGYRAVKGYIDHKRYLNGETS